MSTRRERLREATRKEIKMLARQQMREKGSGGLSLRGVAAEMGFTVTALYRYYRSMDDLITALIADAYDAHADAMNQAAIKAAERGYAEQLLAIMIAYRVWALANAADFQLIYGNPIPGYHAPREITVPKAVRSWYLLGRPLAMAYDAGYLKLPTEHIKNKEMLHRLMEVIPDVPIEVLYMVINLRVQLHGFITLELYGHLVGTVADPDAYYLHLCHSILSALGLYPSTTGISDSEHST